MNGRYVHRERLVALFLFAALLFNPPLLRIFDSQSTVFGFPVLYLYLFVAWAILIALLAVIIEFSTVPPEEAEQDNGHSTSSNELQRGEGRDP